MRRKIGIMLGVALLVAGLAAPAGAKQGGHPGAPSGTGLEVTVEPSGSAMWANSVGDEIPFDITVTNTSGSDLSGVTVKFKKGTDVLACWYVEQLGKNASWSAEGPEVYKYKVVGSIDSGGNGNTGDFENAPISTSTDVTVGTVTATTEDICESGEVADSAVFDSDDAVMTAYPVLPCDGRTNGDFYTTVYFGPNADYSECSFTPRTPAHWTFTTTLEKPKKGRGPQSPSATVRDGIPGNWCNYDENSDPIPQGDSGDPNVVIDENYFPLDGVCLHGGAGGDPFPVRNADTFYLATWTGNIVDAAPTPSP